MQLNEIEVNLKSQQVKDSLTNDVRRLIREKLDIYESKTVTCIATIINLRFRLNSGFKDNSQFNEGVKVATLELRNISPASAVTSTQGVPSSGMQLQ